MVSLEQVLQMKKEGKSDSDIDESLKSQGLNKTEIDSLISQANIKNAIETEDIKTGKDSLDSGNKRGYNMPTQEYEGMQPSMVSEEQPEQYQQPAPAPQQYQQPEQYQQPQYQQQYPAYDQYQSSGVSADTISEISEQIVNQKLSLLKDQLEKTLNFKNSIESKMAYLEDRLSRIEKIIDRLQLSVLQKVGEYVTNVEDIKQELQETQKSFKAALSQTNRVQAPRSQPPSQPQRQVRQPQSNRPA